MTGSLSELVSPASCAFFGEAKAGSGGTSNVKITEGIFKVAKQYNTSRQSSFSLRSSFTETTVFQTGNSVAVRLLGECRLPRGTKMRQYRDGARIVLEAVDEWPAEFLAVAGIYPDDIPRPEWGEIEDPFA